MWSRLRNWIMGISEPVWEDRRGSVTQIYLFDGEERGWRSRCTTYPTTDRAIVEYNIPRFSDYGATEDQIYVYLIEDVLHELSHWASDESDYSNKMSTHWENWRRVLFDEIEYVNDGKIEIRY